MNQHSRAALALAATLAFAAGVQAAAAQAPPSIIGPSVYDWNATQAQKTPVGEFRQIMKGPTATLDELEVHVTELDPGKLSHPPHRHPNEELVIIRQGTVETLSDGVWKRVGPGSVIFNASNSLHALRNVGSDPAIYDVVNWKAPPKPPRQ